MKLSKKADAPTWLGYVIPLVLAILFVIIAVGIQTGAFQKFTEVFNVQVLSKLPEIKPIPIPGFSKPVGKERGLDAQIQVVPSPPACPFEELEFSALNSTLPGNTSFGVNVNCIWDFDTAKDTSGNTIGNDDEDSTDCVAKTSDASIKSSTTVKLTLLTTAGVQDTEEATVSTTVLCACGISSGAAPRTCSPEQVGVVGQTVRSGVTTTITLPKKVGLLSTIVRGVHIKVATQPGETERTLALSVIGASKASYVNSNLEGEFVIEGQNLTQDFNGVLLHCSADAFGNCNVPLIWISDKQLQILEVDIPYTTII